MKQYTIQHYDLYWDCKISIDDFEFEQDDFGIIFTEEI